MIIACQTIFATGGVNIMEEFQFQQKEEGLKFNFRNFIDIKMDTIWSMYELMVRWGMSEIKMIKKERL